MWNIRVQGLEEFTRKMNNMSTTIPNRASIMLDRASRDTQAKMRSEAPVGKGGLANSIVVTAPTKFMRVITPMVLNRSGRSYASAVETGTRRYGTLPNLSNLAAYYGLALYANNGGRLNPVVIAIAKRIKERGTPANPFVKRTFVWIQSQITKHIIPFMQGVTAKYGRN